MAAVILISATISFRTSENSRGRKAGSPKHFMPTLRTGTQPQSATVVRPGADDDRSSQVQFSLTSLGTKITSQVSVRSSGLAALIDSTGLSTQSRQPLNSTKSCAPERSCGEGRPFSSDRAHAQPEQRTRHNAAASRIFDPLGQTRRPVLRHH